MTTLLWAQIGAAAGSVYWLLLPLVAVVSLVYSATRHEEWPFILRRAFRLTILIVGFLLLILAGLLGIQLL